MRNIFFLLVLILAACKSDVKPVVGYQTMTGSTMGTYYKITYKQAGTQTLNQKDVDQRLVELNDGLSTYIEEAVISIFNAYGDVQLDTSKIADLHFFTVFKRARKIFRESDGDFDPTVMPLVNFYGFGYTEKRRLKTLDSLAVEDILKSVSFDNVLEFDNNQKLLISKKHEETQLDFSAIAKGYGVDVLALALENHGINDYLIDIGGELKAKGVNAKGHIWKVAISRPLENSKSNDADIILRLKEKALASSGNYRNFYEVDGQKYSHTINPKTGYPERSKLLGASIIADNCMDADAYATVCMVKGLEASKLFIESIPEIEGCLIYNDADALKVHFSSGFGKYITISNY